jgi:hypothetical protein
LIEFRGAGVDVGRDAQTTGGGDACTGSERIAAKAVLLPCWGAGTEMAGCRAFVAREDHRRPTGRRCGNPSRLEGKPNGSEELV